MKHTIIRNASVINEGSIQQLDVLVSAPFIERIESSISANGATEIDATGKFLIPGLIDDQVHFREPGLTHKADIESESKAAIAGGITSYMEMPNTNPQAITQELLAAKFQRAAEVSYANYSFFMGTTNNNIEEVLKTDPHNVCGVKIFMGSSTGDMLVDSEAALSRLFSEVTLPIAVHAESEQIIKANLAQARERFGDNIPIEEHYKIRSHAACLASSSLAVALAEEHGTRLHVLHISTAQELELFEAGPIDEKLITAEACIHHLWFSAEDYSTKGNLIKWNPAVKEKSDRDAIRKAVKDGVIDVIATDHAPHTLTEKNQPYLQAPSGGPLVQHALVAMLELVKAGVFDLETVVDRMCHQPARCFNIDKRGFIREGYYADLVLVDLDNPWTVSKDNILYKCGWSPFEGSTFTSQVYATLVNGELAYKDGIVLERANTMRMEFSR